MIVENLRVSYGNLLVVDGLSFELGRGEVLALVGPSGCGKTTIAKAILGLVPYEGEIEIHTERVGYCPQREVLFDWMTVFENAVLPLKVRGEGFPEDLGELFQRFGLSGFEKKRPYQLSGGMRQRLSLLRAVLSGRELLVLDEPFSSVDAYTKKKLQVWLSEETHKIGSAVLLITHDIEEAVFLADRVLVLSERPARIVREVSIPFEKPRDFGIFTHPDFPKKEKEILDALMGQF